MNPVQMAYGIASVVLLAILAGAVVTVQGWRADSKELPKVQMRLAATLAAEKVAKEFRSAREKEAIADEQKARDTAAALPVQPIRLCRNPVPAAPGTSPGGEGTSAGAGVLPQGDGTDPLQGPDIGPDLRTLMLEAERVLKVARAAQRDSLAVREINPNSGD